MSIEFPLAALPRLFEFLSSHEVSEAATVCTQWQQGVIAAKVPSCGPKHNNLFFIRIAVPREVAIVPPFFGFRDAQIKGLFSPKTMILWQKVCEAERASPRSGKAKLPKLQRRVEQDILSHALPLTDIQRKQLAGLAGKTLIVRSSSNEDTGVLNAGGNETVKDVPATEEGLRKALAKVIASYFSAKSFNNRSAFENPFQKMPECSALIMVQIAGDIVSGVMITHKSAWFRQCEERVSHIVAARGFGAGTSGDIPTDEWVVTQDRTYSMIRSNTPSLTEREIRQLQNAGWYLERYFQNPRDVEFVIHRNELYIVQDRRALAPEMNNPTFLDSSAIPPGTKRFQSISLIPGVSRVCSVPDRNVLFARDLKDAEDTYRPGIHKAVVIYTPPASANTHQEMNFSSQKPPVPCFLLPQVEWEKCKENAHSKNYNLCPQTGLIVIGDNIPVRKGLFLHPARFSMSVDGPQGVSTHPGIERLNTLLTTTAVELPSRLSEIQNELTHIFSDISHRIAASHFQQVIHRLHETSIDVFRAMEDAARKNHSTVLSFHAKMLRQLVQNNISGLEVATTLPESIESFLKTPRDPVLFELALLAKKAWDEPGRQKWLAFLERNQSETLLARLKGLDALGMLPLWFAMHFSKEVEPTMELLLTPEVGETEFLGFASQFHKLQERVQRMNTQAELMATWETLQKHTDAYLTFCSRFASHTLFQSLQLSRLSHDLIELWDRQIKIVITSQFVPESEIEELYNLRIDAFAQFGLLAIDHHAIATDMVYRYEFQQVLKECSTLNPRYSNRKFSVQHWIVPKSDFELPLFSNKERHTIIHQNLLQASSFDFREDHLALLPKKLENAVKMFQRFATEGRRSSASISILEESASVTFNISLNLHSFVVTIQYNRGSDNVEFHAYWRGSDNEQGVHLEFIQLFSSLTGIAITSYSSIKPDLEVVLEATDWRQVSLVCQMIDRVNEMSILTINHYKHLVDLLTLRIAKVENPEMRIKDFIWKQFTDTGRVPEFINMGEFFDRAYLEKQGHLSMVIARVMEEVEGKRPESLFSRRFFETVLGTLPTVTQQKELILRAVFQGLRYFTIPAPFEQEIFAQLYQEAPIQVLKYFGRIHKMSKFKLLMETVGAPTTPEQAKLHYCYQQLVAQGGLNPTFLEPLLESWDHLEFT